MASQQDEVVDVVVVGSGPSGGVVAHTLAARGFRVVCLEQGDWVSPADYPANYPEWELLTSHSGRTPCGRACRGPRDPVTKSSPCFPALSQTPGPSTQLGSQLVAALGRGTLPLASEAKTSRRPLLPVKPRPAATARSVGTIQYSAHRRNGLSPSGTPDREAPHAAKNVLCNGIGDRAAGGSGSAASGAQVVTRAG
jgi:choline dehydrogenase-like flavoprotein